MRLEFIDANKTAEALSVGDVYKGPTYYDLALEYDITELNYKFDGIYLEITRKSTGRAVLEWCVASQEVFLIVDADTKKILYTSKEYSMRERANLGCPFYEEFKAAFDAGFKNDDGLYQAPDADEFEDI